MLVIIDGQGGGFGKALIAELRTRNFNGEILACGTNSVATAAMLKSGASFGATGENAVIVNSARASVIAGALGIIVANSMLGEMSEKMAAAVANSSAKKVLIPAQKCGVFVAGVEKKTLAGYIQDAALEILAVYK